MRSLGLYLCEHNRALGALLVEQRLLAEIGEMPWLQAALHECDADG